MHQLIYILVLLSINNIVLAQYTWDEIKWKTSEYIIAEDYENASIWAKRSYEYAKKEYGTRHENYFGALEVLVNSLEKSYQVEEAQPYIIEMIHAYPEVFGYDENIYLLLMTRLVKNYESMGDYVNCHSYLVKIIEFYLQKTQTSDVLEVLSVLYSKQSELLMTLNDNSIYADMSFQKAIQLSYKCCGKNINYANYLNNYGLYLTKLKKYTDAEYYFGRSIDAYKSLVDIKSNEDYMMVLLNQALLYIDMKKKKKARPIFDEVLLIAANIYGKYSKKYKYIQSLIK